RSRKQAAQPARATRAWCATRRRGFPSTRVGGRLLCWGLDLFCSGSCVANHSRRGKSKPTPPFVGRAFCYWLQSLSSYLLMAEQPSSSTTPASGPSDKTISRIASTMPWRPLSQTRQRLFSGHKQIERLPRLGHKIDPGRQLALARMSGRENDRKKGPAHPDLARQVDPIHKAGKPDIRKDHGDVSPAY